MQEGMEAFWAWWPEGRRLLAAGIGGDDSVDVVETVSALVAAIHPSLQWQLTPGPGGRHILALSPAGDPALRHITEAWRRLAPEDDEWQFAGARVAADPGIIGVGGESIDPDEVRYQVEPDELYQQLDVMVVHPGFAALDDQTALETALYLLDSVLGEDEVERWVGVIDAEPSGGDRLLAELPEHIEVASASFSEDSWDLIEDVDYEGYPKFVIVDRAVKPIDHLDKPFHLEVVFELQETNDLGLPTDAETARVDALEDDLLDRIEANVAYLARETEDGQRILHLYIGAVEETEEAVDAWLEGQENIEALITPDPAWAVRRRWP